MHNTQHTTLLQHTMQQKADMLQEHDVYTACTIYAISKNGSTFIACTCCYVSDSNVAALQREIAAHDSVHVAVVVWEK